MELKTKEDFVKAFIACGKKYGMGLYEGYPHNTSHSFCNDIPNDLGDEKLYLVKKTVYEDGKSYVEHVTEEWNHSEECPEPCVPYNVNHHLSYEITTKPVFAFFVKPSFIGKDCKIHHIVTDISGTQYNQKYGEYCEPYSGTCHYAWDDNSRESFTLHSDYVQIKFERDSAYHSRRFNEPISVDTNVYYQKGKLFAGYIDYGNGHEGEVELTDDWRAFTTYEEVLEFQKLEEQRLKNNIDELKSMEENLNNRISELVKHAESVLDDLKKFKKKN